MKLTDEQIEELRNIWHAQNDKSTGYRLEFEAVLNAYHAMLNASPTHRVVEAPEGYKFGVGGKADLEIDPTGPNAMGRFSYFLKPIPKPCPAPVLEPVTVTVESVYGTSLSKALESCKGWEAHFALTERSEGFTHYVDLHGNIGEIAFDETPRFRICLRKWEGK